MQTTRRIFPGVLVLTLIVFGVLWAVQTHASSSQAVTGYAWSDVSADKNTTNTSAQGVGWVSFSGSNYSVSESSSGALSGYAWSANLGWINFNGTSVNLSTGKLSGYAQACSVFANKSACSGALDQNAGGWDGKIALSGTASNGTAYGVQQHADCAWTGYAWGSDAVGAIGFGGAASNNVRLPGGAAQSLSVSPTTVIAGQSATLTWSSSNTTSCTINNGANTGGATSGSVSVTPVTTTTYTLTCTPVTGSFLCGPQQATVAVGSSAFSCTQTGGDFTATPGKGPYSWTVDGTKSAVTTDAVPVPTGAGAHSATVSAGGNSANCPLVTVKSSANSCPIATTGTLTATPDRVSSSKSSVTLSWSVSGYNTLKDFKAADCKIIKNNDSSTAVSLTNGSTSSCNTSGTTQVTSITNQTVYSLSCGGTALAHTVVNILPRFNEF